MHITPIKTRILLPPKDNLLTALQEALPTLEEGSVLAITSKVVSIHEGRCVKKAPNITKDNLAIKEATVYLPRGTTSHRPVLHTITHNLLIPSAGIDEFDGYILWPKTPHESAKKMWQWANKYYHIKNFGILIVDSHSIQLRRGTVGISLAHYGFQPLKVYEGTPGLLGKPLGNGTVANLADGLAAAAVVAIGEGAEQTPVSVIRDIPGIVFTTKKAKNATSLEVAPENDIYWPLLKNLPWQKGGGE